MKGGAKMGALSRHKDKKRRGLLANLLSTGIIMVFILAFNGDALSGSNSETPIMAKYTAFPPIGGTLLKPNILLNLDNSTSQNYFAYDFKFNAATVASGKDGGNIEVPVSKGFNPNRPYPYYGYFDPYKKYSYSGTEFTEDSGGSWNGNFLNWLTMRRVDVIRKALVGGKTKDRADSPAGVDPNDLLGESASNRFEGYQKQVPRAYAIKYTSYTGSDDPVIFTFNNNWDGKQNNQQNKQQNNQQNNNKMAPQRPPVASFCIDSLYKVSCALNVIVHRDINEEPKGVIQKVGDRVRWGLEIMDDGTVVRMGNGGGNGGGNGDRMNVDMGCDRTETGRDMGNDYGNGKGMDIPNIQGGSVVIPVGYYNGDVQIYKNGEKITVERKDAIVNWIASDIPNTPATPLAESIWTATGYFQQHKGKLESEGPQYYDELTRLIPEYLYGSYPVSGEWDRYKYDPYNYADDPGNEKARLLPCARSYVITITDGEPTQDLAIPSDKVEFDSTYSDNEINPPVPDWADKTTRLSNGSLLNYFWDQDYLKGSHYVDDIALWGHVDSNSYRDLRTDLIIDSNDDKKDDYPQYLTHYFIYANFGSSTPDGERLLNWSRGWTRSGGGGAARNGGFIESGIKKAGTRNFEPNQAGEYNSDGDKSDDTFYEAKDGYQLELALTSAVYDASKRASSGTASSIITNTIQGEGVVYQAYFYPQKFENNEIRRWLGYINALFVDEFGNLREDSNKNDALDLSADKVIRINYSAANKIEVYKCTDENGDGKIISDCVLQPNGLESIKPIWDGGRWLWRADPASRYIFTTTDGSTRIDFVDTANLSKLQPYLRAADNDIYKETKNIINWIRGDDLKGKTDAGHPDGYRQRSITIDGDSRVWKLGDIIYSSPTAVGRPMENYDLLYGDASYTEFRRSQLKRRQVVYVGANDGMLHAFNAGCYDETNNWIVNDCPDDNPDQPKPDTLGREIWAFIPRGLLPHLKWLTDPRYSHVYYVDLKPKITDVQIFDCDKNVHTGINPVTGKCWGTILIGGFRYGGKKIDWTSGGEKYSTSPEYFALDITDPLKPRLLWTFSDPELGLSMSYPAVARIEKTHKWYTVFGSGATDYDESSDLKGFQNGNIFILEISAWRNGAIRNNKWDEGKTFRKIPTNTPNTFMSNPITVDVNIDYNVDVIYIGANLLDTNNALMYRITTDPDLSQWKLSRLANINAIAGSKDNVKRITSAPSAAMDDRANLWVYFGTGQFLGVSDKNHTGTGAFYAIKDGCWNGTCNQPFNALYDVSDIDICVGGGTDCAGGTDFSKVESDIAKEDGWVLYYKQRGETEDFTGEDLASLGERSLSKPIVLGGLVTWGTYIPGKDECSSGDGENHAYSVYYKTGTAYIDYVFDEQKEQDNPSDVVARVKRLSITYAPAPPTAQITYKGTVKIFFPGGEGAISGIEGNTPFPVRSGVAGCKNDKIP